MVLLSVVPQLMVTLSVEIQCACFKGRVDIERDLLLGEVLKQARRLSIVLTATFSAFLSFS